MNPGGIRADLPAGALTWGTLFTVQPFGNSIVKLTLTGQQIYDLLNQQWGVPQPDGGRILQVSSLSYTWDPSVTEVRDANGPISLSESYEVAANSFIAAGGDNFTVFTSSSDQLVGPLDLDALNEHIATLGQPLSVSVEGGIQNN